MIQNDWSSVGEMSIDSVLFYLFLFHLILFGSKRHIRTNKYFDVNDDTRFAYLTFKNELQKFSIN
jgi:hypothetical protein